MEAPSAVRPTSRLWVVVAIVAVLVPVLGLAVADLVVVMEGEREKALETGSGLAQVVALSLETVVDSTNQTLRLLSASDAVLSGNTTRCAAEMGRAAAGIDHYANIGLIDADGYIRCSGIATADPVYAGDRAYFQEALATGGLSRGTYQVGRITGVETINYGYPTETGGVVYAAIDLTALVAVIEGAHDEDEHAVTLLDGNGVVLAVIGPTGLAVGDAVDPVLLEQIAKGTGTWVGGGRLYAFTHLADSIDAGIATTLVEQDARQVSKQATDVFLLNLLVLFFLAAVGGGTAWFIVDRRVVRAQQAQLARMQRDAQRVQDSDALHVQLVSNIGHDLASPMVPIAVQLKLLARQAPGLTPEQTGRIEVIERNLEQMKRLTHDLRDIFKMDAGRLAMDPEDFDLGALCMDVERSFEAQAADRSLELRLVAQDAAPVHADPVRVTQVLYNFLTNALKFTPEGGRVQVQVITRDGEACVEVTDSGRGLDPDEMERLFQPFSQVHDRSEVQEKGTGLGLYISKGIIEAQGGTIGIKSDGHGQGSTFWFCLPLRSV